MKDCEAVASRIKSVMIFYSQKNEFLGRAASSSTDTNLENNSVVSGRRNWVNNTVGNRCCSNGMPMTYHQVSDRARIPLLTVCFLPTNPCPGYDVACVNFPNKLTVILLAGKRGQCLLAVSPRGEDR